MSWTQDKIPIRRQPGALVDLNRVRCSPKRAWAGFGLPRANLKRFYRESFEMFLLGWYYEKRVMVDQLVSSASLTGEKIMTTGELPR